MATSGTIGNTVINTAKLLEKAFRRCGLMPQTITPELAQNAKEDLFMLIMSLSNRGLNLWCIDKQLMALVAGQATYVLPAGTLSVLNLVHSIPTEVTSGTVVRFGVKFSVLPTASFNLQTSPDNLVWTTVKTYTDLPPVGEYGWFDLDPAITANYWRIDSIGTVEDLLLSSANREIMVTPFNRDDYSAQPNKTFQTGTVTNYYFEKLVDPQITVWPVPNDDTRHLVLYRYRQVQDIGTLTEEIEIPTRWLEPITWQLAARLAFEVPGVEPDRRQEVVAMANSMTIEVEGDETDNAPTYFAPNIRVYTR